METLIYKSSIAVHVLCGILSLASGLAAMIANKEIYTMHYIPIESISMCVF